MKLSQPYIRILVTLLSVWLLSAQTLVLAHDATHAVHIHQQFCDDLGAIGGNLVAATTQYRLPDAIPVAVAPILSVGYQASNPFTPVYQSRAPPFFAQ